jgi:hypothetical protein
MEQLVRKVLDETIAYAKILLALQMRAVNRAKLDLTSQSRQAINDLCLIGAMWKFNEQFELAASPRERAFLCLARIEIDGGATTAATNEQMAKLKEASRTMGVRGESAHLFGYQFAAAEHTLATLLLADLDEPSIAPTMRFLLRTLVFSTGGGLITIVLALVVFPSVNFGKATTLGIAMSYLVLLFGVVLQVRKLAGSEVSNPTPAS